MSKMAVATVRSPFGLGLNISAFAVKLDILKLESVYWVVFIASLDYWIFGTSFIFSGLLFAVGCYATV